MQDIINSFVLRWKNKGIQRYDDIACGQCLQIYILFYDIWYTS